MFPVLALETSSPLLSVALKKGNRDPIAQESLSGFFTHAENLVPALQRLLKKKRIKIGDVKTFLIGRGPGSFTGLRVGFATLKGFLALEKKDCYGALSLDLIAENAASKASAKNNRLLVILDARRDKFYARAYRRCEKSWAPENEARILLLPEVIEEIKPGTLIAGDALIRFKKEFQKIAKEKKASLLPEKYWYPMASSMIEILTGSKKSMALQHLSQPADFVPLYFRLSEAEERLSHAHHH